MTDTDRDAHWLAVLKDHWLDETAYWGRGEEAGMRVSCSCGWNTTRVHLGDSETVAGFWVQHIAAVVREAQP